MEKCAQKCALCGLDIVNISIVEVNGKPRLRHDECPGVDPVTQVTVCIRPGAARALGVTAVRGGGHKMMDVLVIMPRQKVPDGWLPLFAMGAKPPPPKKARAHE